MTRIFTVLAIAAAFLPADASNPGEPLDCSDWVSVQPGFTCSVFSAMSAIPPNEPWLQRGGNMVMDNEGHLLIVRKGYNQARTEIRRLNGSSQEVIGYIDDRDNVNFADILRPRGECTSPGNSCTEDPRFFSNSLAEPLMFDAVNGRLLIQLYSSCLDLPPGPACPDPYYGWWIASIEGFATLFEIMQTYSPPLGSLSFRVPAHPEGFQAADWFDTYYGDLATVGDWSQAQPLQCGYPASPPSVGDYLTVPDPLPAPSPGQGRYYVTAVTYEGERRYGRKRAGGVTSGRDPAVLPGCAATAH